jgi:hypothetical protein
MRDRRGCAKRSSLRSASRLIGGGLREAQPAGGVARSAASFTQLPGQGGLRVIQTPNSEFRPLLRVISVLGQFVYYSIAFLPHRQLSIRWWSF